MKHLLAILALSGMVVSAFALREHYRTDTSPCSINDRWDCGIVNHSPYATLGGIPVAVIGIIGYFLLGGLALRRAYRSLLAAASWKQEPLSTDSGPREPPLRKHATLVLHRP